MDWTKSYASEWRVFRVNSDTWADDEKINNVDSIEVLKTDDGDEIESGSLEVTGDFESDYYRIVMTAEQSGEVARVDVATLLFVAKGGEYDFGVDTTDIDGFSVLHPAATTSVLIGEYAPAGANGAQYAADLLASVINAPIEVEGTFVLNEHVVHELGSSILSAVWAVLNAGDFVIQIDGRGIVHIRPRPTEPSMIIDNSQRGMLLNGISFDADMSDIPNRYVIIDGINITIAENNDPASVVSIPSRKYCVDIVDTSPTPINGETYSAYANRMLKALSVLKDEREYTREYAPDVYPYSIIRASINGLGGDLRVQSQSITCGNGVSVSEKVAKEIPLYG
ncbi:MAG: hypothetical protein IKO36_02140 [Bacteroidaceae bacterium]|nr:hypothetical protein [Bacteroidaceae bacterium]